MLLRSVSQGTITMPGKLLSALSIILLLILGGLIARMTAIGGFSIVDSTQNEQKIIKATGLDEYSRPFHTLRDWRDTTWKQTLPEFVVDSWLGHSGEVSRSNYLYVPDDYYEGKTPKPILA